MSSCLFVSNLSGTSETPSLEPGHRSVQHVLEGDLVLNVFRDGQWGTFRHQLISHGIKLKKELVFWFSDCCSLGSLNITSPSRMLELTPFCVFLLPGLKEELTESAYVNVLTRGDLSSLRWIASPLRHFVSSKPSVQLCHVYFSSLNFRDVMLATGKLPPDAIPGKIRSKSVRKMFLLCLFSG